MGFWGQGIQLDSYFGDQWSTLTSEVIKKFTQGHFRPFFSLAPFSGILKKSKFISDDILYSMCSLLSNDSIVLVFTFRTVLQYFMIF